MTEAVVKLFVPTNKDKALESVDFNPLAKALIALTGDIVSPITYAPVARIVKFSENFDIVQKRLMQTHLARQEVRDKQIDVYMGTQLSIEALSKKSDLSLDGKFPEINIDNLSMLVQEESYTMPRGLTRGQKLEWARANQQRLQHTK